MSNKTPSGNRAKTVLVRKNKLFFVTAFVVLCIVGGVYGIFNQPVKRSFDTNESCQTNPNVQTTTLEVGRVKLTAEIAESEADQQRGLGGRDCLANDRAMLFRYQQAGSYCFWMKDMNFPIDIIWLDSDKKIVTIKANVAPETYPESFCPEKPAQYVIETRAGKAKDAGWVEGTQFSY